MAKNIMQAFSRIFGIIQKYLCTFIHTHRSVTWVVRGAGLPCYFLKFEKYGLILERKAQIVSIFRLDFPIKMFV